MFANRFVWFVGIVCVCMAEDNKDFPLRYKLEDPPNARASDSFATEMISSSLGHFDRIVFDRLDWSEYAEWLLNNDPYDAEYVDWEDRRIKGVFRTSLRNSLRQTIFDLEVFHNGLNWLEGMTDTVWGHALEEEVDPVSLSYRRSNRAWWKVKIPEPLKYGIRPFRTSPYAFATFEVGGRGIARFHARYYYRNFIDHRVEIGSSHAITGTWRLNTGLAYGNSSNKKWDCEKIVLRIEKSLGHDIYREEMFFAGFRVGRNESSFLIGISRNW